MLKRVLGLIIGISFLWTLLDLSSQAQNGVLRERIRNRMIEKYQQQGNTSKYSTNMRQYRQAAQQSVQKFNVLTVNGIERSYLLHMPQNYSDRHQWPLVIALHGGGGHSWPGAVWKRQRADESTQEIPASQLMIDFFLRHPKQ